MAEILAVDVGLPEEKSNGGPQDGFERGGQDVGAHGNSTAEIGGGEAEGVEEFDEGLDLGERGGEDRWVGREAVERVEADGVQVEEFFLEELGFGRRRGNVVVLIGIG